MDESGRERLWKACIPEIQKTLQEGFENNKGFTGLYGTFHMIFGSDEAGEDDDVKRVGTEFDILLREEVNELVDREVTIYRESYADLFMAAALGLEAFGYCRLMFQNVSDASFEESLAWADGVNVHRFRSVAAVLLGQIRECGGREIGKDRQMPLDYLITKGEEYCLASLECAQESVLEYIQQEKKDAGRDNQKQDMVERLFGMLNDNIKELFRSINEGVLIEDAIKNSVLAICIDPDTFAGSDVPEIAMEWKIISEMYKSVQEEMGNCRHVIHRTKCFISILALVGRGGNIVVEEQEYKHLCELYKAHETKCKSGWKNEVCKVVSDYFIKLYFHL